MPKVKNEAEDADSAKRGRRTIEDHWLGGNRDAIVNLLCSRWPEIGWQLTTAKDRQELRRALQPIHGQHGEQVLDRLLRPTEVSATASEIREKRVQLGHAVACMRDAQGRRDQCMSACREIEGAMMQSRPEQAELVLRELSRRRTACQQAQAKSRTATAGEQICENELLDMEAAFAQDELLKFIKKRKYALHPLNLANAIAGLPFAIDVPFLGVWQSHARCSGLECPGWPSYRYEIFETIESIWNHARSSSIPTTEFFQQEIKTLPKTVWRTHPGIGSQRVENYVRAYLSENWWYLQRAIEKSLQSNDDPRPIHFVITSHFNRFVAEPKTYADIAVAKAERISD